MKVIKSAFLRHPLYWYGKKVYYKQYIYIILTFIWLDINVDIDIHHFMLLTRFVFRDTRIINETNSRIIFQTFGCREKRSFLYWWVTVCSGIYKISLGGPTFLEREILSWNNSPDFSCTAPLHSWRYESIMYVSKSKRKVRNEKSATLKLLIKCFKNEEKQSTIISVILRTTIQIVI